MTTCLGKSCSFGLLCVPFVNSCQFMYFGFEGRIWDLIVSVPDHCLSFYLGLFLCSIHLKEQNCFSFKYRVIENAKTFKKTGLNILQNGLNYILIIAFFHLVTFLLKFVIKHNIYKDFFMKLETSLCWLSRCFCHKIDRVHIFVWYGNLIFVIPKIKPITSVSPAPAPYWSMKVSVIFIFYFFFFFCCRWCFDFVFRKKISSNERWSHGRS